MNFRYFGIFDNQYDEPPVDRPSSKRDFTITLATHITTCLRLEVENKDSQEASGAVFSHKVVVSETKQHRPPLTVGTRQTLVDRGRLEVPH